MMGALQPKTHDFSGLWCLAECCAHSQARNEMEPGASATGEVGAPFPGPDVGT